MEHLELHEAILFRLLASFFGLDQVIPKMSLLSVCGGTLPLKLPNSTTDGITEDLTIWAKSNKCLFTIIDPDDMPKLVFDFFEGFDKPFEIKDVISQKHIKPILKAAGVQYISLSIEELEEMTDPDSDLDFFHWLQDQLEFPE